MCMSPEEAEKRSLRRALRNAELDSASFLYQRSPWRARANGAEVALAKANAECEHRDHLLAERAERIDGLSKEVARLRAIIEAELPPKVETPIAHPAPKPVSDALTIPWALRPEGSQ